MKNSRLLIVLLLLFSFRAAGRFHGEEFRNPVSPYSVTRVDALTDTVIFDFTHDSCSPSAIDIPVLYTAGSDRYALDFAMRYNRSKLAFNSMVIHTPGLIASAWYNVPDSTLRFTSFCFQPLVQNIPVVSVRFTL